MKIDVHEAEASKDAYNSVLGKILSIQEELKDVPESIQKANSTYFERINKLLDEAFDMVEDEIRWVECHEEEPTEEPEEVESEDEEEDEEDE